MNETKFSVIIPVYNTKKTYIDDCLSSILNQDYENYEVIIINDGSCKETTDYLLKYKDRCVIINQDNHGLVYSRMVGLRKSSGDYVIFLDSDDIIGSDSFNILNRIVINNNPDVILQDPSRFYHSIEKVEFRNTYFKDGIVTKDNVIKELCNLHINSICNKFVKRALYEGIENSIDLSILNGEDLQQSTYIINKAQSFYYTIEQIYYYRLNFEHRPYYDIERINDLNFLVPTYNILFKENSIYGQYLPLYKLSMVKSIIYYSFRIFVSDVSNDKKTELLNRINNLEITNIAKSIKNPINIVYSMLFFCLIKKLYFVPNIAAHIYNKFIGIEEI